ncbi:MAG: hypothetical protein GKR87_06100 [Kiritimatiellae bacterium]|nr:hypothetical protein [Kiritimatiellia bacterium]
MQFFGSTSNTNAGPTQDPDTDNQDNFSENIAGTDPTNAGSVFAWESLSLENGTNFFTPEGVTGRTYTTSTRLSLLSTGPSGWIDIPSLDYQPTSNGPFTIRFPIGSSIDKAFYRISVQLTP